MRWASLEEWRGRFAISHHLHLPALLDRTHALLRSTAHHLHNDESEKNEADVSNHRLIHPALARLQSRILLGVAKERLDGPATHLAQNHRGEVRPQVVGDDVVVVAVTVSGHDQPQGTVLRSVDVEGYRAHPEVLAPLQSQRPGQLAHAATLGAPEDDRPRMERTDPHQPQPSHHLGEPPGAVVGVEDDVASFEPRAYDLLEHLFGELELVLVGVRSARAFGSPQPESHRYTKPLAVADAPQKHHHVQPVDLALFGEGVGPSCPRKLFGERLLDHAVVQTQVALPTMALARVDQESHHLPGGEGRHPQEPVESVVAAAGQEERHACLRLALVEQDQSAYVERDQHERGGAAKHADAEAIQHESDLGGQRTGGTIQSGRHGETSAGSDWFGQTSSYPVVTSLGFRADQSPYRVSPVNKGIKRGRGCYAPALLVRFATPSFGRFLRNLLALPLHLDEVDSHLAFGVHAVARQNMHSSLRAVRPPGRGLLDGGVGTNEPVEAPGVDRLELYKVPGVGRACPVCGDGEELPLKQAVRMEWREEFALCVSAGGGNVERGMRRDGGDGRLVGVAVQRVGEGL